jgi:hypothetical protein
MSDDAGLGSVDWNLCNEQENEADDKVGQVKIKVLQTKTNSAEINKCMSGGFCVLAL